MKKITLQPGCITCGLCEFLAPEIFQVTDISRVRPDAPVKTQENLVMQAVERCPVQVINYEEDEYHETEKE